MNFKNENDNLKLFSELSLKLYEANKKISCIDNLSYQDLNELLVDLDQLKKCIHSKSTEGISIDLIIMLIYFFLLIGDKFKFVQDFKNRIN